KRRPNRRAAANNLVHSDSPAWISPRTVIGRRRTSPVAPLPACLALLDTMDDLTKFDLIPPAEVPAPHQLLRSPISTGRRQFAKIFGTIDIPRNPGQFEDNAGQARRPRCGEVRKKAVVSEAKREQITGRPPGCIRAASGCVWHQDRTAWKRVIYDLL